MRSHIHISFACVKAFIFAAFFIMSVGFAFAQAKPDLVTLNVTFSKYTVTPGENVTVSFRIANQGNANAGATTTQIRFNQAAARPIPMTPVLGNVSTSVLAAGTFIDQSAQVTIPPNTAPGTYYVWIIADNNGVLNQNNIDNDFARSPAITVQNPAFPDLIPQNLTVIPTSIAPGGNVKVTFTVKNQGNGTANPSTTNIRLSSSSSSVSSSDPLLTSIATPTLLTGASTPYNVTVKIPDNTTTGVKYVWIILDVNSSAGQGSANEANDRTNTPLTVIAPLPDLIPQNLTAGPTSVAPGGNVKVTFTVKNQGNGTANPSTTNIRLSSSSSSVSSSDPLLTSVATPTLLSGASTSYDVTVKIPDNTMAGTKYIWVILDVNSSAGQGSAREANDRANTLLTVIAPLPDLIPQNLTANPTSIAPGGNVTVSFTVKNQGNGAANSSTTNIRLSSSPSSVSTSDPLLTTLTTPDLAAGASMPHSVTVTIPNNTATGTKYIWVILDVNNSAGQGSANEANDKANTPLMVIAATPDLIPQNLTVNPTSVNPGSSVTVSFTVKNQGNGTANSSTTNIQLSSSSSSVSTSDPVLTTFVTPALAAGASTTHSVTVTIPSSTTADTKYIWVILDVNNSAGQKPADKDNDKANIPLVFPRFADLISQSLAVSPASVSPNGSVTISVTVKNQGNGAANASTTNIRLNSSSNSVSNSDPLLTTFTTPALAAGTSTPHSVAVTIPGNTTSGTKYIWVILDANSSAGQGSANEANDKINTLLTVEGDPTIFSISFPLPNRNPYTAAINSVFDHSMKSPDTADGVVVAYTGEQGKIQYGQDFVRTTKQGTALYGFKNGAGSNFKINGNYAGAGKPSYLYYDGHSGIDFRTTDQSPNGQINVLAAASGIAHWVIGSDYNTIYVDHENGYTTHYLHLSKRIVSDGAAVTRGQIIGVSGDAGVPGSPHLHFEVQFKGVPIDPYGWQGNGIDPYTTLNSVVNKNLWLSTTVFGTTVIVHGFQLDAVGIQNPIDDKAKWTLTLAKAIAIQKGAGQVYVAYGNGGRATHRPDYSYGKDGERILIWNWIPKSDVSVLGYSEAAGSALAAQLILEANVPRGAWSLKKLHFIGHSRGTVVCSEAIQRVGYYAAKGALPSNVVVDDKIHFTTLDAHPWDDRVFSNLGDAHDLEVNSLSLNQAVVCWQNVAYGDNYWQKSLDDLNGLSAIPGFSFTKDLSAHEKMDHSGVHAWYYGTANATATTDGDGEDILPSWYPNDERLVLGYNFEPKKLADISVVQTVPFEQDLTFNLQTVFNGDFSRGSGTDVPGWQTQGGEGTAQIVAGDPHSYLRLKAGQNYRIHDLMYIPKTATQLLFRFRVNKAAVGDSLEVYMGAYAGSTLLCKQPGDKLMDYKTIPCLLPTNVRGITSRLRFVLKNGQGKPVAAVVWVDDIRFGFPTSTFVAPISISAAENDSMVVDETEAVSEEPSRAEILQSSIPGDYRLEQNYPNPFNAGTLIRYALPQAGPVVVKIYNAAGQEVRTLLNVIQPPGYYQTHWNGLDEQGRSTPSGFYLYRLEAGSVVLSNKMLMVR